jgi:hypothetical protein
VDNRISHLFIASFLNFATVTYPFPAGSVFEMACLDALIKTDPVEDIASIPYLPINETLFYRATAFGQLPTYGAWTLFSIRWAMPY